MIKRLFIFIIFSTSLISAQVDYSDSWEDFFSYNNVKDFIKSENILYALSDNAIFTYDFTTQEINKLSSVQGLSGETTSAIHYSNQSDRLVIGYKRKNLPRNHCNLPEQKLMRLKKLEKQRVF